MCVKPRHEGARRLMPSAGQAPRGRDHRVYWKARSVPSGSTNRHHRLRADAQVGQFRLHDLVRLGQRNVGVIVKIGNASFQVLDQTNNLHTLDQAALQAKVTQLREELGLEALLVTRSEEGMTLFRGEKGREEVLHEPAQAREVYDVSGAGDTVIASMAVMLASGADLHTAMRIANRTAGIVVGKLGTAVVQLDELRAAL
ncbi:MAG: hypothetical protein HC828_13785 [Blastochloris sp.]|nr:hypothetical protein [Blastochloris sp.]